MLPATPVRPISFAYVTSGTAVLVAARSGGRDFQPPRQLASIERGSGIAAADLNSDGILDLALLASGNLVVLAAELR